MNTPTRRTARARVFAVLFDEPTEDAIKRLAELYRAYYQLTDSLFLVRTRSLAEDVAVATRIKGKEREVNGVVLKLSDAYAGYYNRTLWDWLGDDD